MRCVHHVCSLAVFFFNSFVVYSIVCFLVCYCHKLLIGGMVWNRWQNVYHIKVDLIDDTNLIAGIKVKYWFVSGALEKNLPCVICCVNCKWLALEGDWALHREWEEHVGSGESHSSILRKNNVVAQSSHAQMNAPACELERVVFEDWEWQWHWV